MEIIDAEWKSEGNILTIKCNCGHEFKHSSKIRKIECHKCMRKEDCLILKRKIR